MNARLLMCAPSAYDLTYEINPWMSLSNKPDVSLADRQWRDLYRVLTEVVGARVDLIPQARDAPDMVFTANAGLVHESVAYLSRFRHPERQVEEPRFRKWFESEGLEVRTPPEGCNFEGEGDALWAGGALAAGYLKRSDIAAHRWLAEELGVPVLSLELTDDRWYHLDTCFFAVDANTVAYYPGAFDAYARTVITSNYDVIEVTRDEALRFACNAVVMPPHVVLPANCPRLCRALEARGFAVHGVDLSEFLKSGGAAKCLVLFVPERTGARSRPRVTARRSAGPSPGP